VVSPNTVKPNGAGSNGSARSADEQRSQPLLPQVGELAEACVRYVERAIGVKLDYEPETLSVLDHYLREARASAAEKPTTGALVAHAAGAYFGEVVRRRHASWWRVEGDDPATWRLEFESVYLSFSPVQLVADALFRDAAPEAPEASERLELEEEDQAAVAARLADLPQVDEDEFYAPTTRLEVIDIAVEAIRARRAAAGEGEAVLGPDDYTA
jgi:hypothetical protein